jgi:methionine-rich copper-binding protein CopC
MAGRSIRLTHRLLAIFFVVAGSIVFFPQVAHAHAVLKTSIPAANSLIPPGKVTIQLTYNSRVDPERSSLILIGPDGKAKHLSISSGVAPDVLAATTDATSAGGYVLRWQALSSDGHITRGEIPFRVR